MGVDSFNIAEHYRQDEWPHWADLFDARAADRGWARPTVESFRAEIDHGSVYLGSPETVATKMAGVIRQLVLSRFDLGYATGRVPHEKKLASIELYGREVIPRVRELLSETTAETATGSRRPAAAPAA